LDGTGYITLAASCKGASFLRKILTSVIRRSAAQCLMITLEDCMHPEATPPEHPRSGRF
jgi:hypothetical protein